MKDDYLWDGSGEPDLEVERLEGLLGRYRSESEPPAMPVVPAPVAAAPARRPYLVLVAAAAAVLVVGVTFTVWLGSGASPVIQEEPHVANVNSNETPPDDPVEPGPVASTSQPRSEGSRERVRGVASAKPRRAAPKSAPPAAVTAAETAFGARPPRPFDPLTASHIEQAEILLRSVRNADLRESDDLAIDAIRSRELLDRNVLLRRAAESRGNLRVERLLGSLEPYLLDIANLGSSPSTDDVRSIQERIERKEIVSDLRIYASNSPVRGF